MLGAGPEKQKRGRRSPPFLAGRGSYRFLPPFFFPPFAAFFAMRFIPPFVWDSCARSRSPYRSAAASRHAGGASIRRSSLRLATGGRCPSDSLHALARRVAGSLPSFDSCSEVPSWSRDVHVARLASLAKRWRVTAKKIGGATLPSHPPDRLAASSASCRPFSCRP